LRWRGLPRYFVALSIAGLALVMRRRGTMLTQEQLKDITDKNLARPLDDLELPPAMVAALVRLRRTTVRGLTVLRECDLLDALDQDAALGEAAKNAAIAATRFILNEMALDLNPEGRFDSFATLMRWTRAAAEELKLRTEEQNTAEDSWLSLTIYLGKPKGSVRIRERSNFDGKTWTPILPSREIYDPDFTTRKGADRGMVVVRQVMRRAEELAADEE
jgi:hypothetical protein